MAEASNPKCDEKAGGCKHPLSLHRNKVGSPCFAMGCRCQGFIPAEAPAPSR